MFDVIRFRTEHIVQTVREIGHVKRTIPCMSISLDAHKLTEEEAWLHDMTDAVEPP
jgi:hypothetical protein